jgi:hypothetical protein
MPLCKIRTSRLTYPEIYRINGPFGFLIVALLKLVRCDFPTSGRYLVPCFWPDMQVAADALSDEARRRLAELHSSVPASEEAWEGHYFRRPHQAAMIGDTGGAIFFAPGCRYHLMHVYVQTANGAVSTCTFVASFRENGHTIATTNSRISFNSVPGSERHVLHGSADVLIEQHRSTISRMSDLTVFPSFHEFTLAYDQREKLQSDWDLARGAYVPAAALNGPPPLPGRS